MFTQNDAKLDTLLHRRPLPAPAQLAVRFAHLYVIWSDRYKTRKRLSVLSQAQLDDIGISAAQARAEARKPFWQP